MKKARVISLHYYPIKSCGAINVSSFEVGRRGPLWDREWMIVDATTGIFFTQRQNAKLALIKPKLSTESQTLHIQLPNQDLLNIPLAKPGQKRDVQVWGDKCLAWDEGDEAAAKLSDWLAHSVRLVRMEPDFERHLASKYNRPEAHTGFADSLPFLLTSLDSLAELNGRLSSPVPMNRFRSNIVIEGAPAYLEDQWKKIRIGAVEFAVAKPCSRCVIINTDQETAQRDTEPLKTLASYRKAPEGNKVFFGQNMIHLNEGRIQVGDEVEVLG